MASPVIEKPRLHEAIVGADVAMAMAGEERSIVASVATEEPVTSGVDAIMDESK